MHAATSLHRRKTFCFAFASVLLCSQAAHATVEVIDDSGKTVRLAAPARRIVSLAPHATELVFAAGAGRRLVAVASYSDWPPEARALPDIGGYQTLDLERIIAMKPELVIGWISGNPAAQIDKLRRLGIPVFLSEPRHVADIASNLERIGSLGGSETEARRVAAQFRARIEALQGRYAALPPVRLFYQIWSEPLMTLAGDHILNEVFTLCGGENVFRKLAPLVPTVGEEAVLKAAPEVILAPSEPGIADNGLARWEKWKSLPAVARGNLLPVDGNLLNRSGPRLAEGAESVCRLLDSARRKR